MDRLDAMSIFLAVVDEGSLAGAARRLQRRSRRARATRLANEQREAGAGIVTIAANATLAVHWIAAPRRQRNGADTSVFLPCLDRRARTATAQNEKEAARLAPPRQLLRRATRKRSLVFSRKSSVSAGIRRTTATLNISKQANHDFS